MLLLWGCAGQENSLPQIEEAKAVEHGYSTGMPALDAKIGDFWENEAGLKLHYLYWPSLDTPASVVLNLRADHSGSYFYSQFWIAKRADGSQIGQDSIFMEQTANFGAEIGDSLLLLLEKCNYWHQESDPEEFVFDPVHNSLFVECGPTFCDGIQSHGVWQKAGNAPIDPICIFLKRHFFRQAPKS